MSFRFIIFLRNFPFLTVFEERCALKRHIFILLVWFLDTLDEEESLAKCGEDDLSNADELRLLEEEGEMSIEELRRRYFGEAELPALPDSTDSPDSSHDNSADNGVNQAGPSYFNEDVLNENDDDEYEPPPEPWKKVVRVGADYQVILAFAFSKDVNFHGLLFVWNALWEI